MKTKTIVLALALAAVTPAVVSAQEYVGGPGSKMLYIADNALARIRGNNTTQNQQNPVLQEKQNPAPKVKKNNKKANTPAANTTRRTSSYNPYVGPEGHRAACGNAVRDARRDSTPVPSHVRDIDSVSTNHQVTLDGKTAQKSSNKTNRSFRQLLGEVGQAIAQEAPFIK